jgi:hypothetical protein
MMKRLLAIQLPGNALALWLAYHWLSIGEARTGLLLWSAAVALFTAALFVWMHGAGLAWSRDPDGSPLTAVLRRLPALLLAALVVLALYIALAALQDALRGPAFRTSSWLTLRLRKPIKPATVLSIVAGIFWAIRWAALPIALLPRLRGAAALGFSGLRRVKTKATWPELMLTPVLLLVALWLPFRVLAWRPIMSSFGLEMASFAIRAAAAYLLFVVGLLTLEGMPLLTQRKRAVSP